MVSVIFIMQGSKYYGIILILITVPITIYGTIKSGGKLDKQFWMIFIPINILLIMLNIVFRFI